jgi:signal transduction histidine kinase
MALEDGEDPIPPTQQEYLVVVRRNVDRLIALVNQLLFLARAESHGVELERSAVEVPGLLKEAADTARPAADARSIDLRVDAESLPRVLADRAQILRLVDNLVSNAVKFTPAGGRVRIAARPEGDDCVLVEVSDSGPGIPVHELPLLFERFARASNATRDAVSGTGLGLSISQMIAEAHGSRIHVASALTTGTSFSFTLPAAA